MLLFWRKRRWWWWVTLLSCYQSKLHDEQKWSMDVERLSLAPYCMNQELVGFKILYLHTANITQCDGTRSTFLRRVKKFWTISAAGSTVLCRWDSSVCVLGFGMYEISWRGRFRRWEPYFSFASFDGIGSFDAVVDGDDDHVIKF